MESGEESNLTLEENNYLSKVKIKSWRVGFTNHGTIPFLQFNEVFFYDFSAHSYSRRSPYTNTLTKLGRNYSKNILVFF